jgi:hypothetical protein
MGMDIYLKSILDPDDGPAHERVAYIAKKVADDNPARFLDACWEILAETGGYYREGYNNFGLFTVLGLSWDDVIQVLDRPSRTLPVGHAQHLLSRASEQASISEVHGYCPRR